MSGMKSTNPKDAVGSTKVPMHLWPATATAVGAVGLLEGALKYGRNNWRAESVLASVYVAAAVRHLTEWFEGADNSLDSNVPHLGNALACLAIIVDAQAHGCLIDDRNFGDPAAFQGLLAGLRENVASLAAQYGEIQPVHYTRLTNVSQARNDVHRVSASPVPVPALWHKEKMHNEYNAGTADVWYSGQKADLWVEYKFLSGGRVPVRVNVDLVGGKNPYLSKLQQDWLNGRLKEGRNVWVIVGWKEGGVVLRNGLWNTPIPPDKFRAITITRAEIARAIQLQVYGG